MACGSRVPAAAGRRSLWSRVLIRQASRRRVRTRDTERVDRASAARRPTRATVDTTPRARWRTSTRDGATSRDAPVRARRAPSGAPLDVVDAFFRTLLVDGHADAYARRTDRRATRAGRVARRVARDGRARRRERARDSRTCARSITPRRRRAGEDGRGRHAASSRDDFFDRRRRRRASRARRRARDRTRRAIGRARVTPRWE